MSTTDLIRNSTGAGLLMAMLSMLVVGTAGVTVMKVLDQSQRTVDRESHIMAYRQVVDTVRRKLYAGNTCTEFLGRRNASTPGIDLSLALDAASPGMEFELPMKFGETDTMIKEGFRTPSGVEISSVQLKVSSIERNGVRIPGDPIPKSAATGYIIINPDLQGMNVMRKDASGNYVNRNLFVKVFMYIEEVAGVRRLHSCYDPAGEANYCTVSLQGAYNPDPAVPPSRRCSPDLQCFNYKNGIVAASEPCPAPYVATPIGPSFKTCSWCNPDPAPVPAVAGAAYAASNELDLDLESFCDPGESGCTAGQEISCTSSGYSGLTDEQAREARALFEGNIALISNEDYAANDECLGYIPPEPPVPTPPTGGPTSPPPTTGRPVTIEDFPDADFNGDGFIDDGEMRRYMLMERKFGRERPRNPHEHMR